MEPFIDVLQIFLSKSKVLYISVEDFKKEILFNLLSKNNIIKIKQIKLTLSSYEKLKFIR